MGKGPTAPISAELKGITPGLCRSILERFGAKFFRTAKLSLSSLQKDMDDAVLDNGRRRRAIIQKLYLASTAAR
jgi:hypothetical protein